MRRLLIVFAVGFLLCPALAIGCIIDPADYASLKAGDSYAVVIRKLDCWGEEVGRTEDEETTSVMYLWRGRVPGSSLVVTFENDRLIGKAQSGLW
jgi:hypothetical protein